MYNRPLPGVFALHQVAEDRWELIGPDEDPHVPAVRRWAILRYGERSSRPHRAHPMRTIGQSRVGATRAW
jgi:hypothetical protein